ncbi:MAG: YjbQ family protein [Lentisphaeria bacterium]|nr:YjbQ family protein [Lentisphaeria bacterium]
MAAISGRPITIEVRSARHSQMINITAAVAAKVPDAYQGICHLFCLHTTAGLTINENADPDVVTDLLAELDRLVPWRQPHFRHGEGNSAAHVKAMLTGASVTVPVADGRLQLGVWQGIYFCEFDGPRNRTVALQLIPEPAP